MKKPFLLLFLFVVTFYYSQDKKEIIKQANEMRNHFMKKNYTAYSNYVYDGVIKMFGDKKSMIDASVDTVNRMEDAGFIFKNVNFSEILNVINYKNELQAVVHQIIEMKTPKGNVLGDYYLIAFSKDGKLWRFIDTSGKDISEVRKYFKNLSPELYIPKKKIKQE
ncbi:hypothetical protein [Chryseobacterium sp. Leaf201]|uniref:hypothetical protein n=1 Tax=Chryseobacterium sp. Leaf201 TaxID=1735672 RepID=UPI0006F35220|nr:hypothetical protein [Chryseobacterium sp. Leaf201]KQM50328.1 hypothetical protein ASE55_08820 [Chryseobacterium sp. Leaf201]